jgi:uncharacterized protein YyaL (SSP411 family)
MLASLAEAARLLRRDDYRDAAVRCGSFLLTHLKNADGRLYRSHKDGDSRINAVLEDYANLIDALLELYQLTFDTRWFVEARHLAEFALARFSAPDGGFFDTSDDHEILIVRPRNMQDNATPSGNTMLAKQLIRLAAYTGDSRFDEAARATLSLLSEALRQYPQAFGEALNGLDMLVAGLAEIAVIGQPESQATQALLDAVHSNFRPNVILALSPENVSGDHDIPLLSHRLMKDGQPTVYVCRNFACKLPATRPEDVKQLLM